MDRTNSYLFAVGFVEDGVVRHAEAIPRQLVRRVCRAAQFRAACQGFAVGKEPGRAWLMPVGGPRWREQAGSAFVAAALRVVVQDNTTTFVQELPIRALLPWARSATGALVERGQLIGGARYDLSFVVAPAAVNDATSGVSLRPLPVMAQHIAECDGLCAAVPLHPHLDTADDPIVLMPKSVLLESLAWCQGEREVERGGVYFGRLISDASGRPTVEVALFCPAMNTEATASSVRFTRATWAEINRRRARQTSELDLVGWVHSHPRLQVDGSEEPLVFFLSEHDCAIHAAFFDAPFLFAMVVDAEALADPGQACAVFGWDEHGIALIPRSIHLQPVEVETP